MVEIPKHLFDNYKKLPYTMRADGFRAVVNQMLALEKSAGTHEEMAQALTGVIGTYLPETLSPQPTTHPRDDPQAWVVWGMRKIMRSLVEEANLPPGMTAGILLSTLVNLTNMVHDTDPRALMVELDKVLSKYGWDRGHIEEMEKKNCKCPKCVAARIAAQEDTTGKPSEDAVRFDPENVHIN